MTASTFSMRSTRSAGRAPSASSTSARSRRARGRDPPVAVEQSARGEALRGFGPVLVGPPAVGLDRVEREVVGRDPEHVRAARVEVGRDERGHVPVTPVLAQQRRRVPEREPVVVRPRERDVRGVERSPGLGVVSTARAIAVVVARGPGSGIGTEAEAVERGIDAREPRRDGVGRGDSDQIDGIARSTNVGVEAEERRGHDRRRHGSQRCGPPGEVAPPEAVQAGGLERRVGLGREVGERVECFGPRPEASCCVAHPRTRVVMREKVSLTLVAAVGPGPPSCPALVPCGRIPGWNG